MLVNENKKKFNDAKWKHYTKTAVAVPTWGALGTGVALVFAGPVLISIAAAGLTAGATGGFGTYFGIKYITEKVRDGVLSKVWKKRPKMFSKFSKQKSNKTTKELERYVKH